MTNRKSLEPYTGPAGGWDALAATGAIVRSQGAPGTSTRALLKANQPDGFDCPGCAWPDPRHTSSFEFCENGAKAVAWETTSRTVDANFFAAHTVTALRAQSDHWLESQGRLTLPLRYDASTDHYVPVSWDDAFSLIAKHLHSLPNADCAAFYTSGRTSNEAAFLYQLFVREFGTNNMPDCSNLCHEATSVGLPESLGVGKGTVQLADFELTDLILSIGHNPGTNHPRMLSTLRETSLRGVPLVVLNPLRERGLEAFRSPQHVKEMLTGDSTKLATHYLQPKVGSDPYVLQGLMKRLFELERAGDHSALDRQFISQHTEGLDLLEAQLADLEWTTITSRSGLSFDEIDLVAQLYARSSATIVAYGMGVTQHAHGTQNVQQIANLLLLRGNIGKPGAGICPLRGHSNVQGDRTMGIDERPSPALLDRIAAECGFAPPRAPGCSVIECIELIQRDQVRVLISMGGNFAVAAPDPVATHAAMGKLALTVGIHTKLNRSHLLHSGDALILPALARSDIDQQPSGLQSVTVEDSMSMVHASRGFKPPPSREVRSEPAIVAGMAAAVLTKSKIAWLELAADYDRVRDLVARVIPGFEGFNERVKTPGGLQLHNAAANRQWNTPSGRARFLPMTRYPEQAHSSLPLILSTIRSHDQYNTTIYGMNDRYRGVHGRRDVVFMNAEDMYTRGLRTGDAIRISTHARTLKGFVAMEYAIARGSCAAYFPEANGLVALDAFDAQSHTPAFKSVAVEVLQD